jgi:diguanylate cyclase (GGDEF)-like protein
VLAGLVLAVAGATLLEYILGSSFGIDDFLFLDRLSPQYPGRMAPLSAATFMFGAIALLIHARKPPIPTISQALLLVSAFGPIFGIIGYLYGVPLLYGSMNYTAMAFHTGAGLLVLIVGVLFADPEHGIIRVFLSKTSGGILARVAIPVCALLPVVLGYLFIHNQFNFGELRFGWALLVIGNSAVFVAMIWTLAFFLQARELQWNRAERDANEDSLTGLMNRRYFERRLSEEIKRCERFQGVFSLILFDVDHFKALNDSMGHLAGDRLLQAIACILRASLRETDIVCRFGGEEFIVIAAQTEESNALHAAEKVRRSVEQTSFSGVGELRMTISAGVSGYPNGGLNRDQLLHAADLALYSAKENGRNRVAWLSR